MKPFDYQARNWHLVRCEVLRRVEHRCQGNGCKERAVLVHHYVSPRQRPELAFAFSNLVALCARCHSAYHYWLSGRSAFSTVEPANDDQFELPLSA